MIQNDHSETIPPPKKNYGSNFRLALDMEKYPFLFMPWASRLCSAWERWAESWPRAPAFLGGSLGWPGRGQAGLSQSPVHILGVLPCYVQSEQQSQGHHPLLHFLTHSSTTSSVDLSQEGHLWHQSLYNDVPTRSQRAGLSP